MTEQSQQDPGTVPGGEGPSPRAIATRAAVGGVLAGAVGTIPLGRAPFAVKALLTALPAGFLGGFATAALEPSAHARGRRWTAPVIGGALAAASGAAGAVSFPLDRGMETLARRVGCSHPRLLIGAGTAVVCAAVEIAESLAPDRGEDAAAAEVPG